MTFHRIDKRPLEDKEQDEAFDWQKRCTAKTRGRRAALIAAATGAGKSVQIMTLVSLHGVNGSRSIVATSSGLAVQPFTKARQIRLSDTECVTFCAPLVLTGGQTNKVTQKLVDWVKSGVEKAVIITHAGLRNLYSALEKSKELHLLIGINLFLDEAHHSLSDDASNERVRNKTGRIVEWWLRNNRDHAATVLVTATPYRSDLLALIPEDLRHDIEPFTYSLDEYLSNLVHIEEVVIRVRTGSFSNVIRQIIRKGPEKIILYLPRVNSYVSRAWSEKPDGQKAKRWFLRRIERTLGPIIRREGHVRIHRHTTAKGTTFEISSIDLVTVVGRDGKDGTKEALQRLVETGNEPDVLIVQDLGTEAYNQPSLRRAIVLGPRKSRVIQSQMLGRVLRDFAGKKRVNLDLVIPKVSPDKEGWLEFCLDVFILSMVIDWAITIPGMSIEPGADKAARNVTAGLLKYAGDPNIDEAKIVKDGLTAAGVEATPERVNDILRKDRRTNQVRQQNAFVRQMASNVEPLLKSACGLTGQADRLMRRITGKSLVEMRKSLYKDLVYTIEAIRQLVVQYHETTGSWPIAGMEIAEGKHTWGQIDLYLRPKGIELQKIVQEERARIANGMSAAEKKAWRRKTIGLVVDSV